MENKTEKRRKILLGQFERNELTLYDFIRKYPEEYKNDSKYIDELWKTFGRYASHTICFESSAEIPSSENIFFEFLFLSYLYLLS